MTQQIFMRETELEEQLETQFIIAGIIVFIILILDIFLIMLTNNLTSKWRRASERSQIRSGITLNRRVYLIIKAVFDRESYESMLQNSLILKDKDNKAHTSNNR